MSRQVKVNVIFPYAGFKAGDKQEEVFWKIVKVAQDVTSAPPVVVVLNSDTKQKGGAVAFEKDDRRKKLDVLTVWSVDTCQMWLHGWGYVLDNAPPGLRRIVQFPGDVEKVNNEPEFFNQLTNFGFLVDARAGLVIGEFKVEGRFVAKTLIDQYGTYPLMSVWFPELAAAILRLPLNRPRSEFLNVDVKILREMLKQRKFAYEQTLNMLINCWDHEKGEWKSGHRVVPHPLGELSDDNSQRNYIGCLDQIERTERLLKQRWREVNNPGPHATEKQVTEFIEKFHRLDRLSGASRENAAITIRSLLGIDAIP